MVNKNKNKMVYPPAPTRNGIWEKPPPDDQRPFPLTASKPSMDGWKLLMDGWKPSMDGWKLPMDGFKPSMHGWMSSTDGTRLRPKTRCTM